MNKTDSKIQDVTRCVGLSDLKIYQGYFAKSSRSLVEQNDFLPTPVWNVSSIVYTACQGMHGARGMPRFFGSDLLQMNLARWVRCIVGKQS